MLTWALVRVEEEHVTQRSIGERGAEDVDVVLRRPVADRVWVVDLLPQPLDHLHRAEQDSNGKLSEPQIHAFRWFAPSRRQ